MKISGKMLLRAAAAAAALALVASCATINRFDKYRTENASLTVNMRVPPAATLDTHYNVGIDSGNPIGTAIRIGTAVVKAAEAEKAEAKMREALTTVDVPAIILAEVSQASASALGARLVERGQDAEFLLDLDIHEYGIEAPSWGGAVSLQLRLTPSLYNDADGKIVWRRKGITVDIPASPEMFGVGDIAGEILTAAMLSTLTVEQLEAGFRELALESAREAMRLMEKDFYRARYR